jgi:twitching motility protein PilT
MISLDDLLQMLVERNGSDLHITAGTPPRIRIHGDLVPMEFDPLTKDDTQKMVYSLMNEDQIARFEREWELDFSFGIEGLARFRTNVFVQRGAVGAVFRLVPSRVKNFDELGLPKKLCMELCDTPRGLVLVTGATGSGKSTTLAAMIDYINSTQPVHIMTIEDPIEFVHQNKMALVNQREVGADTKSFSAALKHVLRQDPDVVLVGEMRDLETIEAALILAETGHLTFGTLHTSDAVQTINRIVDVFPAHQQQQIRTQLAFVLEAVFSQQLIPKVSGKGRVLAQEILRATPAVRALIRENKAHQIYSVIQTSGNLGMKTMNQSLAELAKTKQISFENALSYSSDPDELRRLMARV